MLRRGLSVQSDPWCCDLDCKVFVCCTVGVCVRGGSFPKFVGVFKLDHFFPLITKKHY